MNENTMPLEREPTPRVDTAVAGGRLAYFEKISLDALVVSHLSTDTDSVGGDLEARQPAGTAIGPRKVVVETTSGNIDIIVHSTGGNVTVEVR